MHIILVNTERGWRGGERQTLYLAQGLQAAGVDVRCVVRKNQPLADALQQNGITPLLVSNAMSLIAVVRGLCTSSTIISVQNGSAMSQLAFIKPLIKARLVYSQRMHLIKPKLSAKYYSAHQIVAVSEHVATELKARGCNNVVIIPDACQPRTLNKPRAVEVLHQLGITSGKVFATTSALTEPKDPLTMVRAFALFSAKYHDAFFIHFGDGPLRNLVAQEINALGLQNKYILAGNIEHVEDMFSVMNVFVMSSKHEAFGSSVLDAFLYKVPVVSTSAGGLQEAVLERGLLSTPGDVLALSNNLHTMLTDEHLRSTYIDQAYRAATEQYSIESITQQYISVFIAAVE